ncbi:MAG: PASTA domain-containing protein [Clostridia bacterium]|nr:PASTA domain-containing protein [Clostridia bacterium]
MSLIGIIVTIGFIAVIAKLSYIIFVKGNDYKRAAYAQQTKSQIISSSRGTIYDVNGEVLAVSVSVDTVSINPDKVKYESGKRVEAEVLAAEFAEVFGLDYDATLEKVSSDTSVVVIARKVEADKVNQLKEWMAENKVTAGINIDEDFKRYYPNGSLASTLIGFCGTDNTGLTGLEARWNDTLVGTSGVLTATLDVHGDAISDEDEEYVAPENGSNIYLTIDSNIQKIAEKYLKEAVDTNHAGYGGVILMDPQDGDILAMANYPDYDLNDPQNPVYTGLSSQWDELTDKQKSDARYKLWANKNVSYLYEPGSTFKTVVASIGLEEGVVETDTSGEFHCGRFYHVGDRDIYCWSPSDHGYLSLREALEKSCNPSFMQLGQRIGARTMYKYFEAYGLFDSIGSKIASTPKSYFKQLETVGPVELATMSFGQRFSITPLQLITAVSAISNGGTLIEPKIVKQIENTDNGSISTMDTVEIRKVISEETASQVRDMMLSVVELGTGGRAKVTGYEVGGKSGTSEPTEDRKEIDGYTASFIAISPIENTRVVCLVMLFNLTEDQEHQGGTVCGPVAGQILSEVLPYLDITGNNTPANIPQTGSIVQNTNNKSVANVKGMNVDSAKAKLEENGFTVICKAEDTSSSIVVDQMPKGGAYLEAGSIICLYTSEEEKTKVVVPDLKNKSLQEAVSELKLLNLNAITDGSGTVTAQSITAGTEVEEGTVITVTAKTNASGGQ